MLLILLLHVQLSCYTPPQNVLAATACSTEMPGSLDNIATTSCLGFVVFVAKQHIMPWNLSSFCNKMVTKNANLY